MPKEINGIRYYTTAETCKKLDISKDTLFRWVKSGILDNVSRDQHGWRLFTESDITKLSANKNLHEIKYITLKK
jgi:DNA-binding transcriptional MerR regulator